MVMATLSTLPSSVWVSIWANNNNNPSLNLTLVSKGSTFVKFPTTNLSRLRASSVDVTPPPDVSTPKGSHVIAKFRSSITNLPPFLLQIKRHAGGSFWVWICMAAAALVLAVRVYIVRKVRRYNHQRAGTVADLVRRGQLRSDRRGVSRPLKYEDPFNNPFVKVSKTNSTVEMCGKVYRLAPVTLTKEEQTSHQKRRSRAYQWKRPTIFVKEGDPIPPDVDPETVRLIPANHPFATTASDIDEDMAQNNVYQKHGVPFRIRAEHEALQRKLEALQDEQKLNKLIIDNGSAKDYERQFKFNQNANGSVEQNANNNFAGDSKPSKLESGQNSSTQSLSSEEIEKP